MPVHLMLGPPTGAGPPGKAAIPISTGRPGLADIFAALLLQRGSPAPQINTKTATETTEKNTTSNTERPKPLFGQNEPGQNGAVTIKRAASQNADMATAKTQNAMDTFPASPSQGERVNRKSDGELPLSEAQTPISVGFPVLPPSRPTTFAPALPVPILSAPSIQPPEQIAPVPAAPANLSLVVEAQAATVTVPTGRASVLRPVAATVLLPKTFAIMPRPVIRATEVAPGEGTAIKAQNLSLPVSLVPVSSLPQSTPAEGQLGEIAMAVSIAQPATAAHPGTRPVVEAALTAPVVSVLPAAAAPPVPEQTAPVIEPLKMPVSTSPALTQQASVEPAMLTAVQLPKEALPVRRIAGTEAKAAFRQLTRPVSAGLPGANPSEVEAKPIPIVASSVPKALSPSSPALPVPGKAEVPTTTLADMPTSVPTATPAEKPLKTGTATADTQTINNTRVQAVPTRQAGAPQMPPAVAAKQAEKTPDDEAISLVPTATPAAPASPEKPAALAPLSHAERAQIVKQAADGVGAMRGPGRPETPEQMTIHLHPKDWGKLQVSVTLAPQTHPEVAAGQKTVTAHIVAESHQVKAALESQTGELHHALRAAGMNLDKLTVSVRSVDHTGSAASSGSSQPQTNLGGSAGGNSGNGQPGGSSFASFAGNPQSGRQGYSPNYPAPFSSPETETTSEPIAPRPLVRGQIDARA